MASPAPALAVSGCGCLLPDLTTLTTLQCGAAAAPIVSQLALRLASDGQIIMVAWNPPIAFAVLASRAGTSAA